MIAFLHGKLLKKSKETAVILTGGIGFEVCLGKEVLKKMPRAGRDVKIWVSTQFKQDGGAQLYGFLEEDGKMIFETLTGVTGIGPKTALAILGRVAIPRLKTAIASGDASLLDRISGVGTKRSQRIIFELRQQFRRGTMTKEAVEADEDVEGALAHLGYSRREARAALDRVPDSVQTTKDRLRHALKTLSRK